MGGDGGEIYFSVLLRPNLGLWSDELGQADFLLNASIASPGALAHRMERRSA